MKIFLHKTVECMSWVCMVCRRVVEAVGWVVLGVECMLMCMGSELCCGWLQCSCYTEHGRYGLSWMQKLWNAWAGSVWYVGVSYVVKFYCCWTWQIWIVFYVEGCGVSSAEYSVRLVGMNRLESFVVCIVGKMAQDVGMVWNCYVSFPSSLVGFWGSHPYMHLFSFRKLFCDLFLLCFFCIFIFRDSKREETWEGRPRGRCMLCTVW